MGTTWRVEVTRVAGSVTRYYLHHATAAAYTAPTARDAAVQFAADCHITVNPDLTLVTTDDDHKAFVEITDNGNTYLVTARRNTDDA